jgi:hypothetical protein
MPDDQRVEAGLAGPSEESAPRAPTAADLRAIRDAVLAGDHQGAIDAAIRGYGLREGARWDPALLQDGDTDGHTKVVTVGPPAFVDPRTGLPRSAGWLASTIAHENIHLRQLLAVHPVDGGDNYARANTVGDDVNEVQAYDWEIRNGDILGLLPGEREELIGRRHDHYLAISRDPFYSRRISVTQDGPENDYWINPADR